MRSRWLDIGRVPSFFCVSFGRDEVEVSKNAKKKNEANIQPQLGQQRISPKRELLHVGANKNAGFAPSCSLADSANREDLGTMVELFWL